MPEILENLPFFKKKTATPEYLKNHDDLYQFLNVEEMIEAVGYKLVSWPEELPTEAHICNIISHMTDYKQSYKYEGYAIPKDDEYEKFKDSIKDLDNKEQRRMRESYFTKRVSDILDKRGFKTETKKQMKARNREAKKYRLKRDADFSIAQLRDVVHDSKYKGNSKQYLRQYIKTARRQGSRLDKKEDEAETAELNSITLMNENTKSIRRQNIRAKTKAAKFFEIVPVRVLTGLAMAAGSKILTSTVLKDYDFTQGDNEFWIASGSGIVGYMIGGPFIDVYSKAKQTISTWIHRYDLNQVREDRREKKTAIVLHGVSELCNRTHELYSENLIEIEQHPRKRRLAKT